MSMSLRTGVLKPSSGAMYSCGTCSMMARAVAEDPDLANEGEIRGDAAERVAKLFVVMPAVAEKIDDVQRRIGHQGMITALLKQLGIQALMRLALAHARLRPPAS